MNRILSIPATGTLLLMLCAAMLTAPASLQAAKPCPADPVDLTFRDNSDDAVRSDGRKTYTDIDELNSCSGDLGVVFFGPFVFELNALGGIRSANGNVVFEIGRTDGYIGMAVGETVPTTKVQFNFVVDSTRYFLAYWSARYDNPDTFEIESSDINVTRVDENTWVIEALPGQLAKVISQPARGKSVQTDHGTQSAPFLITVVRKP